MMDLVKNFKEEFEKVVRDNSFLLYEFYQSRDPKHIFLEKLYKCWKETGNERVIHCFNEEIMGMRVIIKINDDKGYNSVDKDILFYRAFRIYINGKRMGLKRNIK